MEHDNLELYINNYLISLINRRTVVDKTSGKEIVLTDEDIDLIDKIQQSQYTEPTIDPYEVFHALPLSLISFNEFFDSHTLISILMKS